MKEIKKKKMVYSDKALNQNNGYLYFPLGNRGI